MCPSGEGRRLGQLHTERQGWASTFRTKTLGALTPPRMLVEQRSRVIPVLELSMYYTRSMARTPNASPRSAPFPEGGPRSKGVRPPWT